MITIALLAVLLILYACATVSRRRLERRVSDLERLADGLQRTAKLKGW